MMSQSSHREYKNSKKGNSIQFQESRNRKAERYSQIGREFEFTIASILEKMMADNKISTFTHNKACGIADQQGKDFTVVIENEHGVKSTRSFGVTISFKSWGKAKIKHPDVPQFCFPIGTKPETIEKRILELFKS